MTEDNKRFNISQEVAKAEQDMRQAKILKDAGEFDGCAGHAYFSAFHYARALLLIDGIEARSHAGVIHLISQHFVHNGRLPAETARYLSYLQKGREVADYDAAATFTDPMADEAIRWAETYNQAARDILAAAGYMKVEG